MTTNYTLKNPFGLRDNKIVVIGDLNPDTERGKACNCICPACRKSFEARMGDIRIWHFSHDKDARCTSEQAILVSIYMFVAQALRGSVALPPCYLRLKETYRDTFYENYVNCTQRTEVPDEIMQEYFELSINPANIDNHDDTVICYAPAKDFYDFTARGEDGSYEAIVSDCYFIVNNRLIGLEEYTPDCGIPSALFVSGPNFPNTHIILSFYNSTGCTPKAFIPKLLSQYTRSDNIPCLKINIDETLFAADSPSDENNFDSESSLKHKLTSDYISEKILSLDNMEWYNIPKQSHQKAISYMKQRYERNQLEYLYEYYQKQWNLEKQNKDNFKENNARLATQLEKERQAHATDNSSEKTVALIKAEFQRQLATKDEELAAKNEVISDLKRQLSIQKYKSSSTTDSKSFYEKQLDENIEELNRKYPHPTYHNLPPHHLYRFTERYNVFFCEHCEKWTYEPSSIEDKSPSSYIPLKQFCKDCL